VQGKVAQQFLEKYSCYWQYSKTNDVKENNITINLDWARALNKAKSALKVPILHF
jgi:hypothetical protein